MESVLEREQAPVEEMSEEEREHRRMMSERMRALLSGNDDFLLDKSADADKERPEAPVYGGYTEEHYTPVVPNSPEAPSAAKRLEDFCVIKPGQPLQRFGDMPSAKVTEYASPAAERNLFENVLNDGVQASVYTPTAPAPEAAQEEAPYSAPYAAPYAAPYTAPSESPAPYSAPAYEDEDEDAKPTPRTMSHQNVAEERGTSLLAALSLKTKLVLAAVAAVVVLLLAIVCVNTAIINSINRGVEEREAALAELTRRMEDIDGEIDELTSPEYVEAWAAANGLLG